MLFVNVKWEMRRSYTIQNGRMRDVVNNQDVDKYKETISKYCSVREMQIRGRGRRDKGQLALSTIRGEIM
jgi:hypothetical protein